MIPSAFCLGNAQDASAAAGATGCPRRAGPTSQGYLAHTRRGTDVHRCTCRKGHGWAVTWLTAHFPWLGQSGCSCLKSPKPRIKLLKHVALFLLFCFFCFVLLCSPFFSRVNFCRGKRTPPVTPSPGAVSCPSMPTNLRSHPSPSASAPAPSDRSPRLSVHLVPATL